MSTERVTKYDKKLDVILETNASGEDMSQDDISGDEILRDKFKESLVIIPDN